MSDLFIFVSWICDIIKIALIGWNFVSHGYKEADRRKNKEAKKKGDSVVYLCGLINDAAAAVSKKQHFVWFVHTKTWEQKLFLLKSKEQWRVFLILFLLVGLRVLLNFFKVSDGYIIERRN